MILALVVVVVVFTTVGVFAGPTVRAAIAKELSGVKAEYQAKLTLLTNDTVQSISAVKVEAQAEVDKAHAALADLQAQYKTAQNDIATLSAKVVSLVPAAPAVAAPATAREWIGAETIQQTV